MLLRTPNYNSNCDFILFFSVFLLCPTLLNRSFFCVYPIILSIIMHSIWWDKYKEKTQLCYPQALYAKQLHGAVDKFCGKKEKIGRRRLTDVFPIKNRRPNLKWIARDTKSVSNRVSIRVTYFGLPERHHPNMGILSPGNLFTERILFWVLLLEKIPNRYWTF